MNRNLGPSREGVRIFRGLVIGVGAGAAIWVLFGLAVYAACAVVVAVLS
ncbi:hypothetical protein SEA_GUDMIT_47 [Gordonia phage Gudmit]|nr:hypothetical protein SEA_GUDMIT_47 [Gordonia phage Gudmit]